MGPDPHDICLCVILGASWAAIREGQPPGSWQGELRMPGGEMEFLEESPSATLASYTPENTLQGLGVWFFKFLVKVWNTFPHCICSPGHVQ